MLSLLVNLYEFGQFLRILLWIFLPMVIVTMLVTTWLHYRQKRKTQEEMTLSMEGLDLSAEPEILIAAMRRMAGGGQPRRSAAVESELVVTGDTGLGMPGEAGPAGGSEPEPPLVGQQESTEDARDKMYRGILWMKEKYEQYRDLADQRIEQLKEELAKVEKKYQDLLAGQAQTPTVITVAGGETEQQDVTAQQQDVTAQQQLEEKDRHIAELQSQLKVQEQKTEGLIAKLQHSSLVLLNISRELDGSLLPPQPQV